MIPRKFVANLAKVHLPTVFNPYSDICDQYDLPNAPLVRKTNLVRMLEAVLETKVRTLWIARDLGYRGGRRTGIPLTDEFHLGDAGRLLGGVKLRRATQGPIAKERTADVIWTALDQIGKPVALWNVFPLHPHEPDNQLSNRSHTRAERDIALPILNDLIEMIRPQKVVAIGRDAQLALQHLEVPVTAVRHPSYGGQNEFIAGIYSLYGIAQNRSDLFS